MDIINKLLSVAEFKDYVRGFDFGPLMPDKLVIHHTWKPTKADWKGQRSIMGLKGYYEKKGWSAGPHLFVAEDGIWLFSPMNHDGIHVGSLNHLSIGMEVVGDYDTEVWSGATKTNALGAIKILLNRLNLGNGQLFFHRDVSSKTCPGKAITKEWLFAELEAIQLKPSIPSGNLNTILASTTVLPPSDSTVVPVWAADAVRFVNEHELFLIKTDDDIRDAVKFYRFYQMLMNQ
jgi:hypothetical protein